MKILHKLLVLLVCIAVYTCDNNDDETTPDPTNPNGTTDGFTKNGVFNETPNAYFEIDEDDDNPIIGGNGFPDSYTFFFTDGRLFDNHPANINGLNDDLLLSLNLTNLVFLTVEASDNPSLVSAFPLAGTTYIVSSLNDSFIGESLTVNALNPPYFNSGFEFGTGDESAGIINRAGSVGPTITINAINLDANNPAASTIDAAYTFMNQDGVIITGSYQGSFGVFFE